MNNSFISSVIFLSYFSPLVFPNPAVSINLIGSFETFVGFILYIAGLSVTLEPDDFCAQR